MIAGLLLLCCTGCGGDARGAEEFRIFHLETAIGPPGADGELRCGPPRVACPGSVEQPVSRVHYYSVREAPALTDVDIDRSTVRRAVGSGTDPPAVFVGFTSRGRKAFAQLTREAARLGGRDQGWHHVAVVVGDEIVTFAEIDFDAYPNGIADAPGIQIAAADETDARDLVARLRGMQH